MTGGNQFKFAVEQVAMPFGGGAARLRLLTIVSPHNVQNLRSTIRQQPFNQHQVVAVLVVSIHSSWRKRIKGIQRLEYDTAAPTNRLSAKSDTPIRLLPRTLMRSMRWLH